MKIAFAFEIGRSKAGNISVTGPGYLSRAGKVLKSAKSLVIDTAQIQKSKLKAAVRAYKSVQ